MNILNKSDISSILHNVHVLTCCAWRFLWSVRLVAKPICRWVICCIYNSIPNFFFIESDTCLASWHNCFPESDVSLLTNSRESGARSWYATRGSPSCPKSRAIAPIHWNTAVRYIAWQKDHLYETMKHHHTTQQQDNDLFGSTIKPWYGATVLFTNNRW